MSWIFRMKVPFFAAFVAVFLTLLIPLRAEAHLPSTGLGFFYDGVFHFLLSPEDLIPVIALALLAGQRGPRYGRRTLLILPATWFIGGLLGMIAGAIRGSAFTCVSFMLLGGLIAVNARISSRIMTVLSVFLGFFHGYLNGAGIDRFNGGAVALLGVTFGVFVIFPIVTSFVVPLRRPWTLIVVRVAGSWIAASGVLMLGWVLQGGTHGTTANPQ